MAELSGEYFTVKLAYELLDALEHGSDEHKEWLHDAIMAFQAGYKIPDPRG